MNIPDGQDRVDKQYDRAIILIQYHVQLLWLIFGAFLLAETVLLGAIASIAKDGPLAFVLGGALLGLVLTVPWWASFQYNHSLYTLRVHEARSLEPAAGSFFTSGNALIENQLSAATHGVQIPRLARCLAPRYAVRLLIGIFAVAFLAIVIGSSFQWYAQGRQQAEPNKGHAADANRDARD